MNEVNSKLGIPRKDLSGRSKSYGIVSRNAPLSFSREDHKKVVQFANDQKEHTNQAICLFKLFSQQDFTMMDVEYAGWHHDLLEKIYNNLMSNYDPSKLDAETKIFLQFNKIDPSNITFEHFLEEGQRLYDVVAEKIKNMGDVKSITYRTYAASFYTRGDFSSYFPRLKAIGFFPITNVTPMITVPEKSGDEIQIKDTYLIKHVNKAYGVPYNLAGTISRLIKKSESDYQMRVAAKEDIFDSLILKDADENGNQDENQIQFNRVVFDKEMKAFYEFMRYEYSKTPNDPEKENEFLAFTKSNLGQIRSFIANNMAQLRSVYKIHGPEYYFSDTSDLVSNNIDTHYSLKFVNILFSQFSNLWNDQFTNLYDERGNKIAIDEAIETEFTKIVGKDANEHLTIPNCLFIDKMYYKALYSLATYLDKPNARTPLETQAKILLGKNFIPYSLEKDESGIKFSFRCPKMYDEENEMLTAYIGNNRQLPNLDIVAQSINNNECIFELSYDSMPSKIKLRNGGSIDQNKVSCIVKEPAVRVSKTGQILLDMPMTVKDTSHDRFTHKVENAENLSYDDIYNKYDSSNWFTQQAYDTVQFPKATTKRHNLAFNNGKVLGVDLGINPIVSMAAVPFSITSDSGQMHIGRNIFTNVDYNNIVTRKTINHDHHEVGKYKQARNYVDTAVQIIKDIKMMIGSTVNAEINKNLPDGAKPKVVKTINNQYRLVTFKNYNDVLSKASEGRINTIEELKEYIEKLYTTEGSDTYHNADAVTQLIKNSVLIKRMIQETKSILTDIKSQWNTVEGYNNNTNFVSSVTIYKMQIIKNSIHLRKAYTNWGTDPNNTKHRIGYCKKDYKWLDGVKKNFLNKLASIIINEAVYNDCQIIAIEDLELSLSREDAKDKNEMKALLAYAELFKLIEERAKYRKIIVTKVDPAFTSQVDPETRQIGYRNKDNKAELMFVDGDKLKIVNSDDSAAKEIAIRAIMKHRNMNVFSAEKVTDDTLIISAANNTINLSGAGRRRGAMYDVFTGRENPDRQFSRKEHFMFKVNPDGISLSYSVMSDKDYKDLLKSSDAKSFTEKRNAVLKASKAINEKQADKYGFVKIYNDSGEYDSYATYRENRPNYYTRYNVSFFNDGWHLVNKYRDSIQAMYESTLVNNA